MSDENAELIDALRAGPHTDLSQRATRKPDWWPAGAPKNKKAAAARLEAISDELAELQERLFAASTAGAQDAVLLVLQGMDTAGKGGIVRHVMGLFDPQGVAHHAFKAPTPAEAKHNFLWRVKKQLPAPGHIGVFDRSHYEDVLIHKVEHLSTAEQIEARYGQIVKFERQLAERGTRIIKVMLHLGSEEQFSRLAERLQRPDKYWKYDPSDVDARLAWDDYQRAYEVAIGRTSTETAPWYIVPADQKWRARLCVAELLLHTLRQIDPAWPEARFDVDAERRRLAAAAEAGGQ